MESDRGDWIYLVESNPLTVRVLDRQTMLEPLRVRATAGIVLHCGRGPPQRSSCTYETRLPDCNSSALAAAAVTPESTRMKLGYLIDMDGVIYRENTLIPGAGEFVAALLSTGTPFLFLTNNSAPTPEDLAVRLKHLGIGGLAAKHFYTSAINTADFLAGTH